MTFSSPLMTLQVGFTGKGFVAIVDFTSPETCFRMGFLPLKNFLFLFGLYSSEDYQPQVAVAENASHGRRLTGGFACARTMVLCEQS